MAALDVLLGDQRLLDRCDMIEQWLCDLCIEIVRMPCREHCPLRILVAERRMRDRRRIGRRRTQHLGQPLRSAPAGRYDKRRLIQLRTLRRS
jgi:hypothetical protein